MRTMLTLTGAFVLQLLSCSREGTGGAATAASLGQAGTCDTAARPATPSPAPEGNAVAVGIHRIVAGCGLVLVSSGVPLPPGLVTQKQLSSIRLFVHGKERALYVEPLHGVHSDGSLRAVLVQFPDTLAFGVSLAGHLIFGQSRGTPSLTKPTADRGSPAAVILPTDPSYLVSTQLVGSTVTVAATASWGATFQKYEADFRSFADQHWSRKGAAWEENYYDRAQIYYAWWLRTGNLTYWQRATVLALSYRRDYIEANNYKPAAHWTQLEGLELHYLATGDEASRTAVGYVADVFNVPYYMNDLQTPAARWRTASRPESSWASSPPGRSTPPPAPAPPGPRSSPPP